MTELFDVICPSWTTETAAAPYSCPPSNLQSLWNKINELQANANFQSDYRQYCIISLAETWFKDHDADADLVIEGFGQPWRLVLDTHLTGRGCVLVCKHPMVRAVVVRDTVCTPFYLPCEFPQLFLTVVYIHPKANVDNVTATLVKTVQRLQMSRCPHCVKTKSLSHFCHLSNKTR